MAVAVWLAGALVHCDEVEPREAHLGVGAAARRAVGAVYVHLSETSVSASDGADETPALEASGAAAEGRTPSATQPPGYVRMQAKAQLDPDSGNALVLIDESEERFIPIFIGNTEALSIRLRLDGRRYTRPLTHDLLDAMLTKLGATLVSVRIDELRNNIFIGSVVLRNADGTVLTFDARPSDAIALAIGNQAPIFVAQDVLNRAGHRFDELDQASPDDGPPPTAL